MAPLETGSALPSVAAKDLDGNPVDLSEVGAGGWRVVQFYRGDW